MNKIDRLVVCNFKSYLGTHVIGPFLSFSAIIGPNGSGKSNLMDAISFVLGVKTSQLRGTHLRDLIYRDEKMPAISSAFVEMVYVEKGTEIRFRRSINVKGSSVVSDYTIDGKTSKIDDYQRRLIDLGINIRTKNFLVFQGDVEHIAQKSPKELTQLVEQISGSAELEEDYSRLKNKMEQAEEELIHTLNKKRNVAKEKKQIQEQKKEALEFKNLNQALKKKKLEFTQWQLFHIEKDLASNRDELNNLQSELDKQNDVKREIERKMKDKAGELLQCRQDIMHAEKDLSKLTRDREKMRPNQIKLKEQISFLDKSIKKTQNAMEKARSDFEKHQSEIKILEQELMSIEKMRQEFEAKMSSEEQKEELKLQAAQIREYNNLKQQAGAVTASLRQQLEKIQRSHRLNKESYDSLDTQIQTLNDRKEQLLEEEKKYNKRKERTEKILTETKQDLSEEEQKFKEYERKREESEEIKLKATEELKKLQERLSEAGFDKRQSEHDQMIAECIQSLKKHFPGVRGRLGDLCKPINNSFAKAVAVAMGKNIDAIVVDDHNTGIECIKYLKDKRMGVFTFIPLDSIKVPQVNESYRRLGGSFRLIVDVLVYEDSNLRALLYAVGNTLYCDTMKEAKQLCYQGGVSGNKYKVVVQDGTVIHKNGTLTGGDDPSFLQKAKLWEEKELQQVQRRRDELLKDLVKLDHDLPSLEEQQQMQSHITGLQKRVQYLEEDMKVTSEKIASISSEIEEINAELERKQPEKGALQKAMKSHEKDMNEMKNEILKQEDRIFADFSAKIGVPNIRVFEENRLAQSEKNAEQKIRYANQESRLKNQLEYERSHDRSMMLKKLEKKLNEEKSKHDKIEDSLKKQEEQIKQIKQKIDSSNEEIKERKQKYEDLTDEYKVIKKKANSSQTELTHIEKQITNKESAIDQLRTLRHQIYQRAKLEQVKIPFKKGKGTKPAKKKSKRKRKEQSESEEKEMEEEESEESEDEKLQDSQDIEAKEKDREELLEVDFTSLEEHLDIKNLAEYEQIKSGYEQEISKLSEAIDRLAPNLKAIERFEDVKERYQTTTYDWDEKRKASQAAHNEFEECKKERYKRFMKAFNHIEKGIDQIYKSLTKGKGLPMGGKAYLSLENLEEPYLHGIKYTAMPPMKRFRDMDQLSGGEKTVAALALLFSIHSFQPAPFFVLDEVDAALDNINVGKVSQFIRSRSDERKLQCLVISLKDTFFEKAEALIGIFRDPSKKSSGVLTLDLRPYEKNQAEEPPSSSSSSSSSDQSSQQLTQSHDRSQEKYAESGSQYSQQY